MKKNVLLINDLPGYGEVALAVAMPLLARKGFHMYNLPTALVSNTLDFGKFHILETTEYMKNTVQVWEQLNFHFDAVSTGFIVSETQAKFVSEYCARLKNQGAVVFADPIMGDVGRLYNGVTEKTIRHMKELVHVADYIVPNYTEAVYLAGMEYKADGITRAEAQQLCEKLCEIGTGAVVITSAKVNGQDAVITYDSTTQNLEILTFIPVPARFPGTGDIFSAEFMGKILEGENLVESVRSAMKAVEDFIIQFQTLPEKYQGFPVEKLLLK